MSLLVLVIAALTACGSENAGEGRGPQVSPPSGMAERQDAEERLGAGTAGGCDVPQTEDELDPYTPYGLNGPDGCPIESLITQFNRCMDAAGFHVLENGSPDYDRYGSSLPPGHEEAVTDCDQRVVEFTPAEHLPGAGGPVNVELEECFGVDPHRRYTMEDWAKAHEHLTEEIRTKCSSEIYP